MHRLAAVEWIDEARRGVAEGRGALISSAWSRMPRSSELVVCAAVLLSGAEDEMEAVALLLVVVAIPLSTSIVSGEVSLTVSVWGGGYDRHKNGRETLAAPRTTNWGGMYEGSTRFWRPLGYCLSYWWPTKPYSLD